MSFTKNKVYVDTMTTPFGVLPANPQIVNYGNPVLGDTLNWIKVSGVFKATGGEKYLTLGNFKYDNETNTSQIQANGSAKAGYYIDDVSVIPLDSFNLKANAGKDSLINAGDSVFIGSYTNGIDTLKWLNKNTTLTIDSTRPGFWVKPTSNTCYILTQTVNNFTSSDTVCISVRPLPLKFLEFSASSTPPKEGLRNALLSWKTSNEVNVSHFNIQRSIKENVFEIIAKQVAKNGSYNEYQALAPLSFGEGLGVRFRIEAVDKDGKKSYSETRQLSINNYQSSIKVYPNPAKDFITIQGKDIKDVEIMDVLGRIFLAKKTQSSNNWQADLTLLNKGIFLVRITTKNNGVKLEKLIKE